jgi:serine/tyrosine/threonine adenylyltransferase
VDDVQALAVVLDGRFARELPELAIRWRPEPVLRPQPLLLNGPLAAELGLDVDWLAADGAGLLVGVGLPDSAAPVAQAYAGHQFGWYQPRLGDGRAVLLGEFVDRDGRMRDLHLKGSGRTPFSRGGDGLAAVGPMLREYIVSESMHALGIPTTRALAVTATGRKVLRERALPGAVLARVAASHLRVGTFQYARATGDPDLLRRLAAHSIARHYPDAGHAENRYLALFEAVVAAQASLVAQWMLIGFVHGVMNTDNMTISGETIDYGPCAFLDTWDPATVFSSIDDTGRYAYGNQPLVAEWNLARFADTLIPLLAGEQEEAVALAVEALGAFRQKYSAAWSVGMRAKIGLPGPNDQAGETSRLVDDLLQLVQDNKVDWTTFFRQLGRAARGDVEPVRSLFLDLAAFDDWTRRWQALGPIAAGMDRTNPVYIPRNHLVEQALDAAAIDDLDAVHRLLEAVTDPYRERPGLDLYAAPGPTDSGPYRTFCGT